MTTTPPVGLKLAACPFCGGEAIARTRLGGIPVELVGCTKCGADTDSFRTEAEAVAAWNTRVSATAPEVGEKLAVTLYEAFWMRNAGIVAVAWDAQAGAIRTMWRAIAADALAALSARLAEVEGERNKAQFELYQLRKLLNHQKESNS